LTYDGALAAAVYSADAGGVSATTLEGFGTPDGVYPYLTTVHYDTDNPLPWHLDVGLRDVAARLSYPGTVTGVRVASTGPSGRALSMVLEGSAGEVSVDGIRFARALGLRSTRFTARIGSAAGAPPPPPAEEAIQALPDDAAEIAQRPVRPADSAHIDRRALSSSAGGASPAIDALDPRRHLVTLIAVIALAGLAGAHVPLLLARSVTAGEVVPGRRAARRWAPWRRPTRSR
jgi:hypothetical protein